MLDRPIIVFHTEWLREPTGAHERIGRAIREQYLLFMYDGVSEPYLEALSAPLPVYEFAANDPNARSYEGWIRDLETWQRPGEYRPISVDRYMLMQPADPLAMCLREWRKTGDLIGQVVPVFISMSGAILVRGTILLDQVERLPLQELATGRPIDMPPFPRCPAIGRRAYPAREPLMDRLLPEVVTRWTPKIFWTALDREDDPFAVQAEKILTDILTDFRDVADLIQVTRSIAVDADGEEEVIAIVEERQETRCHDCGATRYLLKGQHRDGRCPPCAAKRRRGRKAEWSRRRRHQNRP